MEEKKARVYRSADERKAEIDEKIKYHQKCIEALEKRKAGIGQHKERATRVSVAAITKQIKENKVDPEKAYEALKNAGLL